MHSDVNQEILLIRYYWKLAWTYEDDNDIKEKWKNMEGIGVKEENQKREEIRIKEDFQNMEGIDCQ